MELKHNALLPLNLQLFAEGESGAGDGGDAGTPAGTGTEGLGANPPAGDSKNEGAGEDLAATVEKLKAEMAKQKIALDNATSEAARYKKELRTKQTQEEIDAEAKKEAEEKASQHVAELERKVARIEATKAVMGSLGVDETTAGSIAESMVGCENVENALLLIKQVWDAKEKKLRIEYGKIPPPGAGGGTEDREKQEAMRIAKELGQQKAGQRQSVRDQLQRFIR